MVGLKIIKDHCCLNLPMGPLGPSVFCKAERAVALSASELSEEPWRFPSFSSGTFLVGHLPGKPSGSGVVAVKLLNMAG